MSFNSKKLYFKALSLSLASVMTFSSAANATHLKSTDNKVSSFSNIKEVASQKLKKCAKIGAAVGIPISIAIGLQTLADNIEIAELEYTEKNHYKGSISTYTQKQKCYYGSISTYIQKQKCITWSLAACLQGMYNYRGIEISQKDIFKKIYKFAILRNEHFSDDLKSRISSINDINSELEYNETSVYINLEHTLSNIDSLKNAILDYYNSIGKEIFAISSGGRFKNIVRIDSNSNTIVVEDPATGLSCTEDLDNFCQRSFSWHSSFIMVTIAPTNLNLPNNNYYLVNDNGYTKHSS